MSQCDSPIETALLDALREESEVCVDGLAFCEVRRPTLQQFINDLRSAFADSYLVCGIVGSQVRVGNYRVDFLVSPHCDPGETPRLIAIECDGHDFHEKTKVQAASDKSRDRHLLLRHGIRTIRFTGSEIWKNAHACADEIFDLLNAEWDRENVA